MTKFDFAYRLCLQPIFTASYITILIWVMNIIKKINYISSLKSLYSVQLFVKWLNILTSPWAILFVFDKGFAIVISLQTCIAREFWYKWLDRKVVGISYAVYKRRPTLIEPGIATSLSFSHWWFWWEFFVLGRYCRFSNHFL